MINIQQMLKANTLNIFCESLEIQNKNMNSFHGSKSLCQCHHNSYT